MLRNTINVSTGLIGLNEIEEENISAGGYETEGESLFSLFTYYVWKFSKAAAEYQSSLPPNLKK